jgi:hypothetical protein
MHASTNKAVMVVGPCLQVAAYTPTPADLDYPAKLIAAAQASQQQQQQQEGESGQQGQGEDGAAQQVGKAGIYPVGRPSGRMWCLCEADQHNASPLPLITTSAMQPAQLCGGAQSSVANLTNRHSVP